MAESTENPDQPIESMLAEVDKILVAIETNYGLSRSDAIRCLRVMAYALETYRPGDGGLKEGFRQEVEEAANNFEDWALRVGRNVFEWRDCT